MTDRDPESDFESAHQQVIDALVSLNGYLVTESVYRDPEAAQDDPRQYLAVLVHSCRLLTLAVTGLTMCVDELAIAIALE